MLKTNTPNTRPYIRHGQPSSSVRLSRSCWCSQDLAFRQSRAGERKQRLRPCYHGRRQPKRDLYAIRLRSAPTGTLTMAPSANPTGKVTRSVSAMTFTPRTFNTPQEINVRAVDDDVQGERVTIAHVINGDESRRQNFTVVVRVEDATADRTPESSTGAAVSDQTSVASIPMTHLLHTRLFARHQGR